MTKREQLSAALICFGLAVAALTAFLLGGCVTPGIACPLGTYPVNAAVERGASGGGDARLHEGVAPFASVSSLWLVVEPDPPATPPGKGE